MSFYDNYNVHFNLRPTESRAYLECCESRDENREASVSQDELDYPDKDV